MRTLFERGTRLVARASARAAGGKIIYKRGDDRVWIDATYGQTEFQVEENGGVRLEHTDRDFIFPSASLVLGGSLATPQRGDRIRIVANGHIDGEDFEVLAPGGAQPYRLCDAAGAMIRVHAKRAVA